MLFGQRDGLVETRVGTWSRGPGFNSHDPKLFSWQLTSLVSGYVIPSKLYCRKDKQIDVQWDCCRMLRRKKGIAAYKAKSQPLCNHHSRSRSIINVISCFIDQDTTGVSNMTRRFFLVRSLHKILFGSRAHVSGHSVSPFSLSLSLCHSLSLSLSLSFSHTHPSQFHSKSWNLYSCQRLNGRKCAWPINSRKTPQQTFIGIFHAWVFRGQD